MSASPWFSQTEMKQCFPWSFQLCMKAEAAGDGARKVSPKGLKWKRGELKQVSPLPAGKYQKNEKS